MADTQATLNKGRVWRVKLPALVAKAGDQQEWFTTPPVDHRQRVPSAAVAASTNLCHAISLPDRCGPRLRPAARRCLSTWV